MDFGGEKHRQLALATAEESIIVAKNENNVLPLSDDQKILLVGPNATSLNVLNGGWTGTWQGVDKKYNTPGKMTVLEAMKKKYGANLMTADKGMEASKADLADVIVVCLGETPYTEKPGDINDLDLDDDQIALFNEMEATGKPVVLLLIEGRPRTINSIVDNSDAVVIGFLPGNEGAEAITNVLSGAVNPSGKLPVTYPRYSNDLLTYDYKGTDLIDTTFALNGVRPQWEFGHGLSYTTFSYSGLTATPTANGMDVNVTVSNTGDRTGKEVVQVYVSDLIATITPSAKRLRAFEKIELEPGETKQMTYSISKDDLRFVGRDNTWVFEPGDFLVAVGDQLVEIEL